MKTSTGSLMRIIAFAVIPVAVAALLVIYSFRLTGRFKTNPSLQERLQDVTLTKEQHYGPAYRIVSSEFVCAGNASWSVGGGGIWVRNGWTTSKAIFRCVLEEIAARRSYADDDTLPRDTGSRKGPIYLEVTDVFGVSLQVESIRMSSWQLTWLGIQRRISSGVFRVVGVVFIIGYLAFLVSWRARNRVKPGTQNSTIETAQQSAALDGDSAAIHPRQ
ncbi:MAG: hypothetical protein JW810_06445 [Sedimentisphaerales bacterium]|nr:hypothetical protein [Sedimentisphaerales bacterium]